MVRVIKKFCSLDEILKNSDNISSKMSEEICIKYVHT